VLVSWLDGMFIRAFGPLPPSPPSHPLSPPPSTCAASQELIHQLMEEIDAAYSALHALRAQLPTNASLPAGTREILARANQGAGATRGPSPTPPDQPQQPHPLQELAATPVPPLPTDPQVGQTGLPPQQPAQPRADSPPARPESAMNLEERAVGK